MKRLVLSLLLPLMVLSGCASRVTAPVDQTSSTAATGTASIPTAETAGGDAYDGDADEVLSEGCVDAWRKAVKGDEPGAMKELTALEKRYPKAMTVKFMMGQVEDRSGKKKEATKYYEAAVAESRFDTMYLFKLAESLRTTGNAKQAIPHYRTLIELNPTFVPGKLGLARALYDLDKKSPEAREQAEQALKLSPDDKDVQAFLKTMDDSKGT